MRWSTIKQAPYEGSSGKIWIEGDVIMRVRGCKDCFEEVGVQFGSCWCSKVHVWSLFWCFGLLCRFSTVLNKFTYGAVDVTHLSVMHWKL